MNQSYYFSAEDAELVHSYMDNVTAQNESNTLMMSTSNAIILLICSSLMLSIKGISTESRFDGFLELTVKQLMDSDEFLLSAASDSEFLEHKTNIRDTFLSSDYNEEEDYTYKEIIKRIVINFYIERVKTNVINILNTLRSTVD